MSDSGPAPSGQILVVFGTRPEAIKMAPVIRALRARDELDVRIAVTAQHRGLLDQVLAENELVADIDLDLMEHDQALDALAARVLTRLGEALDQLRPARVLVHGDTVTSAMAMLAAYFRCIPVGHVEAGLRSGDLNAPWPEEGCRKMTGAVADLHFAPTVRACDALRRENVPASAIHLTGNTAVDAVLDARERVRCDPALAPVAAQIKARFAGRRIIAVTAHRRENFGDGMRAIAEAIRRLAKRDDVGIVYPIHPNPNVTAIMHPALAASENVALIEPVGHLELTALLDASHLALTDSGGIQEEAPSLGTPVLVLRDTTERPEGIEAGTAKLVGAGTARIVAESTRLLDDPAAHAKMCPRENPYGDGRAAERIAAILAGDPRVRSCGSGPINARMGAVGRKTVLQQ
ncbi:MAG: UDP-N-acetylglucosamine 2-epimerase (non-hydrolyzing) [Erythrobacter sp.]